MSTGTMDPALKQDTGTDTGTETAGKEKSGSVAPTKKNAEQLGEAYSLIGTADKAFSKADKTVNDFLAIGENCLCDEQVGVLIQQAVVAYRASLITRHANRKLIQSLPAGTVAPGGANRQTVVVGRFGRVDERLGKVMDRSDANRINKASFG